MIRNHSLSIIFCAVLAGCGGSSDTTEPGPLDNKFYGVWSIDTLAYVAISKNTITTFAYDIERGCYEAGLFKVDSSTASSLTSTDLQSGEQSTSKFELKGEQLVVEEDGNTLYFSQADDIRPYPGCESFYGIKSAEIQMELAYLPPQVKINRNAQLSGRIEYDYGINFDINKNGVIDSGDVSIKVRHFKGAGNYSNNREISIANLGGSIWTYVPDYQSELIYSTSNDNRNSVVQLIQTDNNLTFNFNITQHPLLAHLNEDTPVIVNARINYPEPEPDVIDGWQDGPWNWSSNIHNDRLPEQGFVQPSFYSEMIIEDATGDLTEGESMWVDIKKVQFKFRK